MDWKIQAKELHDGGLTYNQIAAKMGRTYESIKHGVYRARKAAERLTSGNGPVGVIGDVHAPFNHPNYLQFCVDTFRAHGVGSVVCIGDIVDHHAISRFQKEPDSTGAYDELDAAIFEIAKFTKAFPSVRMCKGNHDAIPTRQAATIGMGERYLKDFHELLKLPETWVIDDEFIIDNVLYRHGINCLGKNGAINAAIQERMSLVMGHAHAFGGCNYSANKRDIIFGLNVGCGIDIDAYAFAYGKYDKNRPTLGCGVVLDSNSAIFVPMGAKYFRK